MFLFNIFNSIRDIGNFTLLDHSIHGGPPETASFDISETEFSKNKKI